jgi:hypothetical protein
MIVGNGTHAAGIHALRSDPMWVADGIVFLKDWPQLLVAMARAMLAGKNPPPLTMPPQAALTKRM